MSTSSCHRSGSGCLSPFVVLTGVSDFTTSASAEEVFLAPHRMEQVVGILPSVAS